MEVRTCIGQFWESNKHLGKAFTVKHFVSIGVPRSTVYSILRRCEKGEKLERRPGSGRKAEKLTKRKKKSVVNAVCDKVGVSRRQVARKFGVSPSYIQKVCKEAGVKFYKRKSSPEWSQEMERRQRRCLRKMNRTLCRPTDDVQLIIDDESYFPFKHDEMPGNSGYSTLDKENTPPDVKLKQKRKYPKKLLVWMAISSKGHTEPFFRVSGMAMNGEVYRESCIRQRLVPFIAEHHSEDEILFWPDLASAHYAKATTDLLNELNISFVPKAMNPPNVPGQRPIEHFWGMLKERVYRGNFQATSEQQMKRRVKAALRDMDWEAVQGMMDTVKTNIRRAADKSPRSLA